MKTEKTIKKIRKAIRKIPDVMHTLIGESGSRLTFAVEPKNKVAFRFFRDQLDGDAAKSVNYHYGIGGSMKVEVSDHDIHFVLYNENGKKNFELTLSSQPVEPELADDTNYALPA